jgi:hypothetical protein
MVSGKRGDGPLLPHLQFHVHFATMSGIGGKRYQWGEAMNLPRYVAVLVILLPWLTQCGTHHTFSAAVRGGSGGEHESAGTRGNLTSGAAGNQATGGAQSTTGGAGAGGQDPGEGPVECSPPERECGGACIGEGTCCGNEECPAGQSCVANACTCNEGTKACESTCIASSACCSTADCPTGGTCANGECSCPDDTHECNGACVSNDSPDHCGAACSPCSGPTGGGASCDGSSCKPTCPTGQKVCFDKCIAANAACTGQCTAGTHNCNDFCVADDAATACGTSCLTCPVPANSTASCSGGTCGFTCKANYKKCGSTCIANSACCTANDCGTGMACTGSACVCSGTTKLCNGACIASIACCSSIECTGGKTCNNNTCGCPGSKPKECSGTCFASSACCSSSDCSNNKICSANQCVCAFSGAQAACGSCLSWDFESGTQSWELHPANVNGRQITQASTPVFSGSHSLAVYTEISDGGNVIVQVPFCSTNLNGKSFSARIRFASGSGNPFPGFEYMVTHSGASGTYLEAGDADPNSLGQWHTWTATLPFGTDSDSLVLYIGLNGGAAWKGTMYLDEIVIQ